MPELPEVETVVRSIRPLVGRRILSAEFSNLRVLRGGVAPVGGLVKAIVGATLDAQDFRGAAIGGGRHRGSGQAQTQHRRHW